MQNIVLVIHLLLALLMIGAVLLQRSEGGALGIGGGGNLMSGRGAATALQKATWGLAAAFIVTSLTLTFFAFQQAEDQGLRLGQDGAAVEGSVSDGQEGGAGAGALGAAEGEGGLLNLAPETEGGGGPALPPPIDRPAPGSGG